MAENNNLESASSDVELKEIITWTVIDCIIILCTFCGNILTILAIKLSKKLSEVTSNQFIFNLALSDLMIAFTIPYHLIFNILIEDLKKIKETCLMRFVLIILACSNSIYNLLVIAADRYLAIMYPLNYNRYITNRVAMVIKLFGWIISFLISTVLLYWNNWKENNECSVKEVLPNQYINYIITPMFLSIWLAMLVVYLRIWREARNHAKMLNNANKFKNEQYIISKSVQMVLLILGSFSICWLPYFITITYMQFGKDKLETFYEIVFRMAVANSSINPIIYAWKNKNFRSAFCLLLQCKKPTIQKKNSMVIVYSVQK